MTSLENPPGRKGWNARAGARVSHRSPLPATVARSSTPPGGASSARVPRDVDAGRPARGRSVSRRRVPLLPEQATLERLDDTQDATKLAVQVWEEALHSPVVSDDSPKPTAVCCLLHAPPGGVSGAWPDDQRGAGGATLPGWWRPSCPGSSSSVLPPTARSTRRCSARDCVRFGSCHRPARRTRAADDVVRARPPLRGGRVRRQTSNDEIQSTTRRTSRSWVSSERTGRPLHIGSPHDRGTADGV
jgi:hypothetical protein